LPENHQCSRLGVAHAQRHENVAEVLNPKQNSYQFSISFGHPRNAKGHVYMGRTELKHLIPAALLIIGIGFSIVLYNQFLFGVYTDWHVTEMTIFALLLTASFLIHEMAHKVIAQIRGLWAEFRLIKTGAVITLISVFTPLRLIAPGAVMIAGPARPDEIGEISIAGPSTNIALSLVFLAAAFAPIPSTYATVFYLIASFNAFIALFNLIPFGILDGQKIFNWNKKVWAAAIAVAAALTIYTYLIV
jgi:Zn-dependent protease